GSVGHAGAADEVGFLDVSSTCEPTSPAAATRTRSTMPRMPFRPRSFMSRTINSRRTEGKPACHPEVILQRMDSLTHVYFAWRLAEVSGPNKTSAYAALCP